MFENFYFWPQIEIPINQLQLTLNCPD